MKIEYDEASKDYRKCDLAKLVACFLAIFMVGCSRCQDKRAAALQAVQLRLDQATMSNLLREASVCIAGSTQSEAEAFYYPKKDDIPAALKLDTGGTALIRLHGASAPYMSIRIPIHFGVCFCWWNVYICIKPGGGFAKDRGEWAIGERSLNGGPVMELSKEFLLFAEERSP